MAEELRFWAGKPVCHWIGSFAFFDNPHSFLNLDSLGMIYTLIASHTYPETLQHAYLASPN